MPELPDLEVFSRNLTKKLIGKKVSKITISKKAKIKVSSNLIKKTLEGQKLKKIYREGKELYFEFSKGDILSLHLMLRGELYLFKEKHDRKSAIIEFLFSDKSGLVMSDYQWAAHPTLNPEEKEAPDALSKTVTTKLLKEIIQGSKAAVKNILLDQSVIRGIGNAYADEILWKAKISPFAVGSKIPDRYITSLSKAIKSVLKNAQKNILKADPHIISGEIRDFLVIHNHQKDKSPTGAKIQIKSGSRKTYYTDEQELFK